MASKNKTGYPSAEEALSALRRHSGSGRKASEELGTSFKTVYRRLKVAGYVTTLAAVQSETAEAMTRLSPAQWDKMESWIIKNAEVAPDDENKIVSKASEAEGQGAG